jgi:hypothetical protein
LRFDARNSPLGRGRTARNAANPVNAIVNYLYGLAEVECHLALIAVGLDPGLGIVHTDKKDRDSLALDLLEPIRPLADRHVLELLAARHFRASDFHETRDGVCRLMPSLTAELAGRMTEYALAIAPIAEHVAHVLAGSSPGKVALRTPLTRANVVNAQARSSRLTAAAKPVGALMPSCRECGEVLWAPDRKLCSACWSVTRRALATQRASAGVVALNSARAAGTDPTQSKAARAKRRDSLLAMKASEADWTRNGSPVVVTEQHMREVVLPALASLTIRQLQQVTGLAESSCSMIRSGKRSPHPRHWDALAQFVDDIPARV